ncbi:MAG: tRNA (adenosine(37)-N6)-threonylcarbamoyltransferase complex transferase subunit TsaD [Armatimonadota bacterium]|nr:tRNA (adenosine(37)-N6)-threonylcarbamoyltransferase complex transferase subunit TsaD [Armatimonadota bacterium]
MYVLGIETSCDETSVAVVRDGVEILSNLIASQVDIHALTGGVVPEVAARKHVERLGVLLEEALHRANLRYADIDLIAVTNRPGLVGALMVGVSAGKALAYALGKPIVAVHHLEGHIASNFLAQPDLQFPFVCLIVSGGHTDLHIVEGHGRRRRLGSTRDDAAGEAFDKGARLLGLGYPGGPHIDRAAKGGNPQAIAFPRAWLEEGSYDFSFSGLKTALLRYVQQAGDALNVADAAASFQEAIVEVLVGKALRAAEEYGIPRIAVCGGVAANSRLKELLSEEAGKRGYQLVVPPLVLCTDNAAMIAAAGYFQYTTSGATSIDFDTIASEALAG